MSEQEMAEETVEVSLNGLLDEAIGELKPWQRWAVERNFRRQPANRRQVLQAVEVHLAKTAPALMAVMDAESFTADTKFATTPAGKGELLQIILDNLPAILDAILKLIGLFGAMLLAVMLLTSSADAQSSKCTSPDCQCNAGGGECPCGAACNCGPAVAEVYESKGLYAGYGSSGSAVASYGSSGSAASKASYGCCGSAAAPYGSSGSAVSKDLRPLRSVLENKPVRSRAKAAVSLAASVPAAVGNTCQAAIASAQARADERRKGRSPTPPAPRVCLEVAGGYAVVRESSVWYSIQVE